MSITLSKQFCRPRSQHNLKPLIIRGGEGGPDYVVCGSCQQDFPLTNLVDFMQHKRFDCDDLALANGKRGLLCQSCPEVFSTPWKLLKHAQNNHALAIYSENSNVVTALTPPVFVVETVSKHQSADISNAAFESNNNSTALAPDANPPSANVSVVEPAEESERSEADEYSEKISSSCGCNDQSCGITVMPGTHAELEKCCSAVVPKKRKRHIATKHLSNTGSAESSGRYFNSKANRLSSLARARSILAAAAAATSYPANIYIDLAANNDNISYTVTQDADRSWQGQGTKTTRFTSNRMTQHESGVEQSYGDSFQSVIIQPGSTFSIPVLYRKPTERLVASQRHGRAFGGGLQADAELVEIDPAASAMLEQEHKQQLMQQENDQYDETGQSLVLCNSEDSRQSAGNAEDTTQDGDLTPPRKGYKRRRYPTSKPFKCDKCEDSFNQRIHLKKHQSKHTGVKPFKCEQCDYSTVERSHLKVHIRVHTGEKPFKCTYCKYATAQNSTLKVHLMRHHADVVPHDDCDDSFVCMQCGSAFSSWSTLTSHSTEHGNKMEDT